MEFLLLLTIALGFAGYLLSIPTLVLGWREMLSGDQPVLIKPWRLVISKAAIGLVSCGVVLWLYAVVRELQGSYSYDAPTAIAGRWLCAALILISALSKSGVRKYLVLASVGLFVFFSRSIAEWFI